MDAISMAMMTFVIPPPKSIVGRADRHHRQKSSAPSTRGIQLRVRREQVLVGRALVRVLRECSKPWRLS